VPAALTSGFQSAFWVLGGIALLAVPAIFLLVRRDELATAVARTTTTTTTTTTTSTPRPALATAE
jgi:hypothetical protein